MSWKTSEKHGPQRGRSTLSFLTLAALWLAGDLMALAPATADARERSRKRYKRSKEDRAERKRQRAKRRKERRSRRAKMRRARKARARKASAPRRPAVSPARLIARKLVRDGVQRLRDGDYVSALDLFSRAYEAYPSPKIQFNIAQTYVELGRYLEAIAAYESFVKNFPQGTSKLLRALAVRRIKELTRRIGRVRVRVNVPGARVSIDGEPRGVSPIEGELRLMPGSHSMVVKKDGYITAVVSLRLVPGQRLEQLVDLRQPKAKVVRIEYRERRLPKKGLPTLWTGVALTGAAGLTAAVLGGLALRQKEIKDDVDGRSVDARLRAARRGRIYQRATDGLLIGAGVMAVGTLAWYLAKVRPSGGTERIRVTPSVGPRGGGLSLDMRW